MATRTPASKINASACKTAVNAESIRESAQHVEAAPVEEQDLFERFRAAADELAASMGVGMTPRRIIGWVLGMTVACGVGYLIGTASLILMIAAGISTYSFMWWLGAFVTMLVGGFVGGKLGGFVMEYVGDGHLERHVGAAKSWVAGLFSSKARPATA